MMEVKKTTKAIGENYVRGKPIQKSTSSSQITGRAAFGEVGNKMALVKKAEVPIKGVISNRENIALKPLQKSSSTTLISCRPALCDLGNRIAPLKNQDVAKKNVHEKVNKIEMKSLKPSLPTKPVDKFHLFSRKDANLKQILPQEKDAVKVVSYSSNQLKEITDIDENTSNPLLVADYIKDIMNYLLELEERFSVKENYLLQGHESTPRMRSVLLNWLVEVHDNFGLLDETLHLTIAIIDRYLQLNKSIGRLNLQLVGVAALLIATKYEEIFIVMDLEDFVYVTDDTYTKKQILSMEQTILKTLEFNLGRPLPLHFLRRYNKAAKATPQQHMLGKYLLELFIIEHSLGHIKPSLQAAAASYLAKQIFNETEDPKKIWNDTMVHYTTYSLEAVKKVANELAVLLLKAPTQKYQATRTKFAKSSYNKISTISKLSSPIITRFAKQAKILKV